MVFDTGRYFLSDPTAVDSFAMFTIYIENMMDWVSLGTGEFNYIKLDPNTTIDIGKDVGNYTGRTFITNNIIYFKNNLKITIINNYSGKAITDYAFIGLYKPS